MAYSDNIADVLDSYDDFFPERNHTLTESNSMEYAKYLHAKHGYYVFNPEHALLEVRSALYALMNSKRSMNDRNVKLALEKAGRQDINFLRSYTDELRPPVRAGEGWRKAHPGHWADITGNLKAAYDAEVD